MKSKRLVELFWSILFISAFTFGGGLAMIAMMRRRFVQKLHWLDEEEMLDITAMAQIIPGPNFTNAAIMVGWRIAGILGALTAILAAVTPPLVIISLISTVYTQFCESPLITLCLQAMRIGVAAYLLDVLLGMVQKLRKDQRRLYTTMLVVAVMAKLLLDIDATALFVGCFVVGIADLLREYKKGDVTE